MNAPRLARPRIRFDFNAAELDLLLSALDSHIYWQLSDDPYRHDGAVREPGSDDPDNAREIRRADALRAKLDRAPEYDEKD